MNTLKTMFGQPKNISSEPLVYKTNPTMLSVDALDQHLHWYAVAMVNYFSHAMHAVDLHVHIVTKQIEHFGTIWSFRRKVSRVL